MEKEIGRGIEGGREGQLGSKYSKMTDVDIGFCYWRHIHISLILLMLGNIQQNWASYYIVSQIQISRM